MHVHVEVFTYTMGVVHSFPLWAPGTAILCTCILCIVQLYNVYMYIVHSTAILCTCVLCIVQLYNVYMCIVYSIAILCTCILCIVQLYCVHVYCVELYLEIISQDNHQSWH